MNSPFVLGYMKDPKISTYSARRKKLLYLKGFSMDNSYPQALDQQIVASHGVYNEREAEPTAANTKFVFAVGNGFDQYVATHEVDVTKPVKDSKEAIVTFTGKRFRKISGTRKVIDTQGLYLMKDMTKWSDEIAAFKVVAFLDGDIENREAANIFTFIETSFEKKSWGTYPIHWISDPLGERADNTTEDIPSQEVLDGFAAKGVKFNLETIEPMICPEGEDPEIESNWIEVGEEPICLRKEEFHMVDFEEMVEDTSYNLPEFSDDGLVNPVPMHQHQSDSKFDDKYSVYKSGEYGAYWKHDFYAKAAEVSVISKVLTGDKAANIIHVECVLSKNDIKTLISLGKSFDEICLYAGTETKQYPESQVNKSGIVAPYWLYTVPETVMVHVLPIAKVQFTPVTEATEDGMRFIFEIQM